MNSKINPKVSVIVPVYNVEKYIARCAISIFKQTYQNLEIVFVDDCTPDKSFDVIKSVIKQFPDRINQIKIISLLQNRGSSCARNTGIYNSTGDYIYFCDGDDWVESDFIDCMIDKAVSEDCDIVYSDYFDSFRDREIFVSQNFGTDKSSCIESMMYGRMYCAIWNKIFKRSLYSESGISFIDGADYHEDAGTVVRWFAVAHKIGYIHKPFYHYVQYNEASMLRARVDANKNRQKCLQRIKNVDVAVNFLKVQPIWNCSLERAAADFKLRAKNELLTDNLYSLKRWIVTFPEADKAIWHCSVLTLNMRFLLTWLHFHLLCLYNFQKKFVKRIL